MFAVVALLGVAACGDDVESGTASISIESPVVVVPSGANTALYMTIVNDGDGADALTEVRSQVADEAQLHRTTEGDDGLTRMEPVDELEVEAGGSAVFEPGGLHVMLLGVDDLVAGDQVEIELVFAESGPIDVQAEVRAISDVVD
ncbi:MAG: copper chaperone PCu(A)C [Acidimicrobiia bacterium]|nr:copper chaperone PCu(A)C [Acidimicrobiia bacterium]